MKAKRKILISIGVCLFIMLSNYIVCNTSIPLPNELSILQGWGNIKRWLGCNKDSLPNEVLLINVAYDKQLVDYYTDEPKMPLGQIAITDRQKLYDFLKIAKTADNYQYIMLDIFFEKGIESEVDSALFSLIASMNRIVIATHEDEYLQDTALYAQAAIADYTMTQEESNFSRFQFLHANRPSIPLRMYQDICGKDIKRWGFLYFSNGWLCRNGITLKLPINTTELVAKNDNHDKRNIFNLGVNLLSTNLYDPIAERIDGKIIVIGDFKEDEHDTYLGKMSGSIICLNAFYALVRGDHVLLGRFGIVFLFYLVMGFVYFAICMAYLNEFSLTRFIESHTSKDKKEKKRHRWMNLLVPVLSVASIGLLFWIAAGVAYAVFDIVYSFWLPAFVFGVMGFITNIKSLNYETTDNESKAEIPIVPARVSECTQCGSGCETNQLQTSVSEQSTTMD